MVKSIGCPVKQIINFHKNICYIKSSKILCEQGRFQITFQILRDKTRPFLGLQNTHFDFKLIELELQIPKKLY
jgi:hypothetical protein